MKELVTIFKGLSDPIRLRMVGLLLQHDELCVCDLMAALQLPQSTTSRHLSYLQALRLADFAPGGIVALLPALG